MVLYAENVDIPINGQEIMNGQEIEEEVETENRVVHIGRWK